MMASAPGGDFAVATARPIGAESQDRTAVAQEICALLNRRMAYAGWDAVAEVDFVAAPRPTLRLVAAAVDGGSTSEELRLAVPTGRPDAVVTDILDRLRQRGWDRFARAAEPLAPGAWCALD
jgi:hypothetical protein